MRANIADVELFERLRRLAAHILVERCLEVDHDVHCALYRCPPLMGIVPLHCVNRIVHEADDAVVERNRQFNSGSSLQCVRSVHIHSAAPTAFLSWFVLLAVGQIAAP